MLVLANGRIVTDNEVLSGFDLLVEGNRIRSIDPVHERRDYGDATIIDAKGGYILPGLIDLHADYIEHMAAPRPTTLMDFRLSLREAERELITHGITTMFHSLSFYNFTEFLPNPIRSTENTRRFIELIDQVHNARHLIRHRFHARFEIDSLDRIEELNEYIRARKVHLVSFMDHTPGQGQYRNLEIYRNTLKGYRKVSDDEIGAIIARSQGREKLTLERIREISELASTYGVAVASHDDDTVEKVAFVQSFGATISEFPITMEVAREARSRGMHTVAGAPNVLLGGSHSGNLSAAEAILAGSVDILCSDYYPAAMLHAVFQLHFEHRRPLPEMVRLVTRNPAAAVGLGGELGSISAGMIADLLVVEILEEGFPVVATAIVDGQVVSSTLYRDRVAGVSS